MSDQIPRSSRALDVDLGESPAEARKRRREWRSTLAHTPEWLIGSDADVANPSDAELDAIWQAGGRVDVGRPFAAAHLLAAYQAGVAAAKAEVTP
jgi:hypothetical protein